MFKYNLKFRKVPGQKPKDIAGVNWKRSQSALLLVCKALNTDAAPFLYAQTCFIFSYSEYQLAGFLRTVPLNCLRNIRALRLRFNVCDQPENIADRGLRDEHIKRWTRLFESVAVLMPKLESLDVFMVMPNMTDDLKLTFRPTESNKDIIDSPHHLVMRCPEYLMILKPFSKLNLAWFGFQVHSEELRNHIDRKSVDYMYQDQWESVDVNPTEPLLSAFQRITHMLLFTLHHHLEHAMKDIGSKDSDKFHRRGMEFKDLHDCMKDYFKWSSNPVQYVLDEIVREREMRAR